MTSFSRWGFIYLGIGEEDPAVDRAVIERGGLTTTIVAVAEESDVPAAAVELVEDGAQTIELCGGFSVTVLPKVIDAVDGRVPVGQVRYGMEAIPGLADLFATQSA